MNSCSFVGRFVKDPEVRKANGVDVLDFTLAIPEYRKTKEGKVKTVDFLDFVAWDSGASTIAKYCLKGDKIAVPCSARQERWNDDSGNKRYPIKFRVNKFDLSNSFRNSDEDYEEDSSVRAESETEEATV